MSAKFFSSQVLVFFAGFFSASVLFLAFFLGQLSSGFVTVDPKYSPKSLNAVSIQEAPESPKPVANPSNTETASPEPPKVLSEADAFAESFEDFLNGFLSELSKKVSDYKRDKRILKEIINPFNLDGTASIEKSYNVFREEIAPMLRKKRQGIIDIFEQKDKRISVLLEEQSKPTQEKILKQWREIKTQHLSTLIDFFEIEEQLIQAHEKLLKFYFVHSKLFHIDLETGAILFDKEKHSDQEKELLGEIEKLRSKQKK